MGPDTLKTTDMLRLALDLRTLVDQYTDVLKRLDQCETLIAKSGGFYVVWSNTNIAHPVTDTEKVKLLQIPTALVRRLLLDEKEELERKMRPLTIKLNIERDD